MMMYHMCACPPLQFVLSRGRIMHRVKLLETITQLAKSVVRCSTREADMFSVHKGLP